MPQTDRRRFLQGASALALAALSEEAFTPRWSPKEEIRLGLLGAGRAGRDILTELAKFANVKVVAVAEPNAVVLRRALRRARGASGHASWQELVEKEQLDGVVVATPTYLHKEPCLAAIERGLAVFCEAPLAASVEDARAIAGAALGAKAPFQVGHHARSNPVYGLARRFYRSNNIGDLIGIEASWRRKDSLRRAVRDPGEERARNWRLYPETCSGLIGEEGSHQLDTIDWFIDRRPVEVRGSSRICAYDDGRENPDTQFVAIRYDNGAELHWSGTLANSYRSAVETLVGTMGTIRLSRTHGWLFKEADAPVQGWEVYASRQQFHDERGITLIADATKLASQGKLEEGIGLPNPPLYYSLEAFAKAIAEGQSVPCTSTDGFRIAALSALAHQASLKGEALPVPDDFWKLG